MNTEAESNGKTINLEKRQRVEECIEMYFRQ